MDIGAPVFEQLLSSLVEELDLGDTRGIALTGSYARGEATRYSDVDLLRFVGTLPRREAERYTLAHRKGHLVSITKTTIAAMRAALTRPQDAIMVVPALRQARVLLDKDGSLDRLKREATQFSWEPLREAADEYASYSLMGYAEEVHKVLTGLIARDEPTALYGTIGLVLGLAKAVAVQRGLLIRSENSMFHQVQDAVGQRSSWTNEFRLASGLDAGPEAAPPVEARGLAGLRLYEETALLLRHVLRPHHLQVVEKTLATISESGFKQKQ